MFIIATEQSSTIVSDFSLSAMTTAADKFIYVDVRNVNGTKIFHGDDSLRAQDFEKQFGIMTLKFVMKAGDG